MCGGPCEGYVVSYGDALYRSLDAVRRLRDQGLPVGLVNKCHVNAVDEEMLQMIGQSKFVLVVEPHDSAYAVGYVMCVTIELESLGVADTRALITYNIMLYIYETIAA